jgi:hypothetical protein
MSSTASSSKRKRREEQDDGSSSDGENGTVFRGWLDEGTPRPDGTIDHESFAISFGDDIVEIEVGDAVTIRSTNEEDLDYPDDTIDYYGSSPSKYGEKMMIARVERIWEERKSRRSLSPRHQDSVFKFRARWFLKVCYIISTKYTVSSSSHNFDWNHYSHLCFAVAQRR